MWPFVWSLIQSLVCFEVASIDLLVLVHTADVSTFYSIKYNVNKADI